MPSQVMLYILGNTVAVMLSSKKPSARLQVSFSGENTVLVRMSLSKLAFAASTFGPFKDRKSMVKLS